MSVELNSFNDAFRFGFSLDACGWRWPNRLQGLQPQSLQLQFLDKRIRNFATDERLSDAWRFVEAAVYF